MADTTPRNSNSKRSRLKPMVMSLSRSALENAPTMIPPESIAQAPQKRQIELFASYGLGTTDTGMSQAFQVFDSGPIFLQDHARTKDNVIRSGQYTVGTKEIKWEVSPAKIATKQMLGKGRRKAVDIFPNIREQLVEQAIRRISVQKTEETTRLFDGEETGRPHVLLSISLYEIWNALKESGHKMRYDRIREALDVLAGSRVKFQWDAPDGGVVSFDDVLVAKPAGVKYFGEEEGTRERYVFRLHPLASLSIASGDCHTLNYQETMRMKSPLARRIAVLLTLHFRQAQKPPKMADTVMGGPMVKVPWYNLTLNVLLERAGFYQEPKTRLQRFQLVERVHDALEELKANGWITIGRVRAAAADPYADAPVYERNQVAIDDWDCYERRILSGKRLDDIRWALFASTRFAEEITQDNVRAAKLREGKTVGVKAKPGSQLSLFGGR